MKFLKTPYSVIVMLLIMLVSCASQQKLVRKAEAVYEAGEYAKAVELFEKVLEGEKSKSLQATYNFMIAESYRHLNNTRKAEAAYRKAIRLKTREKEAYYWAGYMALKNEKYKEATAAFKAFQKAIPKDVRGKIGLESVAAAQEWKEKPTRYIVENVKNINSHEHDFCPAYMSEDFLSIYFTSSRTEEDMKQSVNQVSGMYTTRLYESRIDRKKGVWNKPVMLLDTTLNTEFDNGALAASPDGTTVYYTICKMEQGKNIGCQIYTSLLRGGVWTSPQRVDIVADSISVGHPSISADGLELYFASRMKGGIGGSDIWKVQRISESAPWGSPVNLGPEINTESDEDFPYIREDGVLFFSSNGRVGMGGFDIFRAAKDDLGKITVINMQSPINSSGDDFAIIFQGSTEKGLFTSNRKGGRGEDDIYSFELPELQIAVTGKLRDMSTKKPIADAEILLIGSDGSRQSTRTKAEGEYSFKLNQYVDYIILGAYPGFLRKKMRVSTRDVFDNKTFDVDIDLITMAKPVEVPNIFYESGKWNLNEESKKATEGLGKLLDDNPNITIEIGAHTDMVGDPDANMNLSKRRAQSVVDYLLQQGYDAERIVARGFGSTRPVVVTEEIAREIPEFTVGTELSPDYIIQLPRDLQEKANQINRRTELKILSSNYIPKPEFFEKKKNKK
ncbi:MAG: OmpA family protein [Bacteroidales bacterium]|jgi:peptidoglycan-associated lipoprotein|nr:OmpA family protein [Bacteroidales bacterium]